MAARAGERGAWSSPVVSVVSVYLIRLYWWVKEKLGGIVGGEIHGC